MKYAGLVYYKEKGVEDLVTFTAAKDLKVLVQVSEGVCAQWFYELYLVY